MDVRPQTLQALARAGFDPTEGRKDGRIEIAATADKARELRRDGIRARLVRDRRGRTAAQRSRAAIARARGKLRGRMSADPLTGTDAP